MAMMLATDTVLELPLLALQIFTVFAQYKSM